MKKHVIISLVGTQDDGTGEDVVELVTEGSFYKRGRDYYITYKESELTGMEGTTTTLKVQGSKVTMLRFGENNTQLIFEKGQRHLCCYETMYGALTVGVWADDVSVRLDDSGGEVSAYYSIDVDNNAVGKNNFRMQIRECQ